MSRIFRSRWKALFWALGICWTAYDLVPAAAGPEPAANAAAPTDATGEPVDGAALAILANAAP